MAGSLHRRLEGTLEKFGDEMALDPEAIRAGRPADLNRTSAASRPNRRYAWYVLLVLQIVYVLNFVDRQILAILAEDLKHDLAINDAQLGFLYGTAFSVFYATFGIILGRLADVWSRTKLIAIGVSFWSAMTALSGMASGFMHLALCRFGVGIGEASASPAAHSVLYDYFPVRVRTTALSIYATGIYVGGGLGLFIGGVVLEAWKRTWPDPELAPLGLKAWQAAFMMVGLPGILVAMLVFTMREPVRGQHDHIKSQNAARPLQETLAVLVSMIPLANWWMLVKSGRSAVLMNLFIAAAIALAAGLLVRVTGNTPQWVSVGIGLYAAVSWAQGLARRDPVIFGLIFRCGTLLKCVVAAGGNAFIMMSFSFWLASLLQRYYGLRPDQVGTVMGLAIGVGGVAGSVLGGVLADKLRLYTPRGKLYVWFGGTTAALFSAILLLMAKDITLAITGMFLFFFTKTMTSGPFASTVNDLMLPRGRATVSAFSFAVHAIIGAALGPYITGFISDTIAASGVPGGEALRQALLWILLVLLFVMLLLLSAMRHLERDEATLLERSRALGENV